MDNGYVEVHISLYLPHSITVWI